METMRPRDRKSTRLNSSHLVISYAVFCLKKKKIFISDHSDPSSSALSRICARLTFSDFPLSRLTISWHTPRSATERRTVSFFFFLHDPAPTNIYTLSLHDALPI